MDLAKVDQDVAYVAYFCKCFQLYVARVLKKYFKNMLQQVFYVDVAYLSHICCKYFIGMLHMFHTYVATVFSNVSSMSDICCIQVFHVASVSRGKVGDGRTARTPGMGAR
jgi:hypothetical protein